MRTQTICLAFFIGIPFCTATSQWVRTNGPDSGSISSLAVSGTNLFAGTWGGGVFRSTNNGISWTEVHNGLTDTDIHDGVGAALACMNAEPPQRDTGWRSFNVSVWQADQALAPLDLSEYKIDEDEYPTKVITPLKQEYDCYTYVD